MPLSEATLDLLESDYARLLDEAILAALEYRRRRDEALAVARFLRSGGRPVQPPDDVHLEQPADHALDADPKLGVVLDDQALESMMMRLIPTRESGFKPSEMVSRLVKEGIADDGSLSRRVVSTLVALEGTGALRRREADKRFQAVAIQPIGGDEDDDLPF